MTRKSGGKYGFHIGKGAVLEKRTAKDGLLKGLEGGMRSFKEVRKIVQKAKSAGLKVITTNGCFDILHIGHVRYLHDAKRMGDVLVVGVNSDNSVRALKGKNRPIVPAKHRGSVLAALKPVDVVFIFNDRTPTRWLSVLKPHIHVKGADRSLNELPERAAVEKHGGKIVRARYHKGHSTTDVIRRIIKAR